MFTVIGTFITNLVAAIGAEAALKALRRPVMSVWQKASARLPAALEKERLRKLAEFVNILPFAYRQAPGTVESYFVDPKVSLLDPGSLRVWGSQLSHLRDVDERLRTNRKILLTGDAGVGKSTFQRYFIGRLLAGNGTAAFLNPLERPAPFFIPLVALQTHKARPIFRFIHDTAPALARLSELEAEQRLIRVAVKRGLLIVCDGYDEVAAKDEERFLQQELSWLFHPKHYPKAPAFYREIHMARVWLATRREFFRDNPVADLGVEKGGVWPSPTVAVAALNIDGVTNRKKLVEGVFNQFRQSILNAREVLNEEYFLWVLDNKGDDAIKKDSKVPLFLMVMCYVYSVRATRAGTHKVNWLDSFHELIDECVTLLLSDLDAGKMRERPAAEQEGMRTRRNLYPDEKRAFLRFFAYRLYDTSASLFDRKRIITEARSFFDTSQSPNRKNILDSLMEPEGFVSQLISSNVLRISQEAQEGESYDFPHRHFREVLAAEYCSASHVYVHLLQKADRKDVRDVLLVLKGLEQFKSRDYQDASLRALLYEATAQASPTKSYVSESKAFAELMPSLYRPTEVLGRFIVDQLQVAEPHFLLSKALLEMGELDVAIIDRVAEGWAKALRAGAVTQLAYCSAVLLHTSPAMLQARLIDAIPGVTDFSIRAVVLQFAILLDIGLVEEAQNNWHFDDQLILQLAALFAHYPRANRGFRPTKLLEPRGDLVAVLCGHFLRKAHGENIDLVTEAKTTNYYIITDEVVEATSVVLKSESTPLHLLREIIPPSESNVKVTVARRTIRFVLDEAVYDRYSSEVIRQLQQVGGELLAESSLKAHLNKGLGAATDIATSLADRFSSSPAEWHTTRTFTAFENGVRAAVLDAARIPAGVVREARRILTTQSSVGVRDFFV